MKLYSYKKYEKLQCDVTKNYSVIYDDITDKGQQCRDKRIPNILTYGAIT